LTVILLLIKLSAYGVSIKNSDVTFYIVCTFITVSMARKHVRAVSSESAKRKSTSKNRVVTKVNYIPGTKRGRFKTYDVITKKREKK